MGQGRREYKRLYMRTYRKNGFAPPQRGYSWEFKEGDDLHFGYVRAVHLPELVSLEEQFFLESSGEAGARCLRAQWRRRAEAPAPGAYLSLHLPGRRVLLEVKAVRRSCDCCRRSAATQVFLFEERRARQAPSACECARGILWSPATRWREADAPPGHAASDGGHARREMSGVLDLFRKRKELESALYRKEWRARRRGGR